MSQITSNTNTQDKAIDLVAQMRFILNETFCAIAENCDNQDSFNYWYFLQQDVQDEWNANKPAEYIFISEFAD